MAQKTVITLTDDIDGTEAGETIGFALDGVTYEIDLSDQNADGLRAALGPYVLAGRRTGGRVRSQAEKTATEAPRQRPDLSAIRTWARDNGYQVSDRGRLSKEIQAAYEVATSPAA